MLVLFPLRPDKVAAVMVVSFLTFSHYRWEIFFRGPCPPYTSLYDLSHQIKIVSFSDIVVEVALSNNGLNIPVFLVQNLKKSL